MKQFYFLFILTFFCNVSIASNANATLVPTASISGGGTVCQNAAEPTITFTGSGGTAPYTFVYTINGGPNQTVTTQLGNAVTIQAPTTVADTYCYWFGNCNSKCNANNHGNFKYVCGNNFKFKWFRYSRFMGIIKCISGYSKSKWFSNWTCSRYNDNNLYEQ
jgi:hypothetical protein